MCTPLGAIHCTLYIVQQSASASGYTPAEAPQCQSCRQRGCEPTPESARTIFCCWPPQTSSFDTTRGQRTSSSKPCAIPFLNPHTLPRLSPPAGSAEPPDPPGTRHALSQHSAATSHSNHSTSRAAPCAAPQGHREPAGHACSATQCCFLAANLPTIAAPATRNSAPTRKPACSPAPPAPSLHLCTSPPGCQPPAAADYIQSWLPAMGSTSAGTRGL